MLMYHKKFALKDTVLFEFNLNIFSVETFCKNLLLWDANFLLDVLVSVCCILYAIGDFPMFLISLSAASYS
jgi:hypothetical protein